MTMAGRLRASLSSRLLQSPQTFSEAGSTAVGESAATLSPGFNIARISSHIIHDSQEACEIAAGPPAVHNSQQSSQTAAVDRFSVVDLQNLRFRLASSRRGNIGLCRIPSIHAHACWTESVWPFSLPTRTISTTSITLAGEKGPTDEPWELDSATRSQELDSDSDDDGSEDSGVTSRTFLGRQRADNSEEIGYRVAGRVGSPGSLTAPLQDMEQDAFAVVQVRIRV